MIFLCVVVIIVSAYMNPVSRFIIVFAKAEQESRAK